MIYRFEKRLSHASPVMHPLMKDNAMNRCLDKNADIKGDHRPNCLHIVAPEIF